MFQCSSASRKFSIASRMPYCSGASAVSVLFSEPKILNRAAPQDAAPRAEGFSALQRAENSQWHCHRWSGVSRVVFQCSSASRKFSIPWARVARVSEVGFQCSSASRKVSISGRRCVGAVRRRFQCSSASRKFSIKLPGINSYSHRSVSVLFSEPKILNTSVTSQHARPAGVSVLFSEPKILNVRGGREEVGDVRRFQCSSASRKFSIFVERLADPALCEFQCSSASRKFSILRCRSPQRAARMRFQCSSASRKFLNYGGDVHNLAPA